MPRVATKLENMENLKSSGNLKKLQNFRENSRTSNFLTWKTQEKCDIFDIFANDNELLREKF